MLRSAVLAIIFCFTIAPICYSQTKLSNEELVGKISKLARTHLYLEKLCHFDSDFLDNQERQDKTHSMTEDLINNLLKKNNIIPDTDAYYDIEDAGWLVAYRSYEQDDKYKKLKNQFNQYAEISDAKVNDECKKLYYKSIKELSSFK